MCGIVGAIAFNQFEITEPYLIAMRDTMVHRGPDGAGVWVSQNRKVGLGHRRLSIIDLSTTATQPMIDSSGDLVLSFNGEIYNHVELRKELTAAGVNDWQTDHSDTEVLLKAFKIWGIDCLHKLRGMFAFAIWDAKQQQLWLARDRIGIKPLYYSQHHGRLTFASEIKALLSDPEQPRKVNDEALYHYLSFLTTPAPNTLFDGIQKLPGGCWLRIAADGNIRQHRYWDIWDHTKPDTTSSPKQHAEHIIDELRTAVKYRKKSDVPVGVFLSGGIDSSTNLALFSEDESSQVNAFSIGYQGEYESYQNELHYAKRMAQEVSANYHERLLTVDNLMDFLPEMVKLQDEPIADPVCVPVYYVSKLARDNGTIVCQVGEGADELFWGYPSWKIKLNLQRYSDLPLAGLPKKLGLKALQWWGKDQHLYYELLRRGVNKQPVFWGGAEAFTENQKHHLLSQRMRQQFKDTTSWDALQPIWQRFQDKAWDKSALNWMSYVDLNFRLPELLLMRVDKMSMGVSLEARVPFLDHEFVAKAMSIPARVKTEGGILKNVLKRAVRGVIPDEIIDRKKQGFGVPVYEWFFDKLGDHAKQTLHQFCKDTDYFQQSTIDHLLATHQGPKVWYLLNFALWHQMYIQQKT